MTPSPTSPADGVYDVGALVWVFLGIYLTFVLGLAAYGFYKSSKLKTVQDKVEDHFVASKGLGLTVVALTVFATVFSGYTVVGVPGEVWALGYIGFRWIYTTSIMGYPMIFMASRLYTLGTARNYISPTDFIKDRYGSWSLAWFTSLGMVFPTIVYAMAQFKSIGATIQGISDGKIDDFHAALILCIVMIIYEIFGGLRAIAYTDVVQGLILICAFLLFFIVQEDVFGGLEDSNRFMSTNGLNRMLSKDFIEVWVGFGMMLGLSYAFYPQIIIRTQAAKSASVLKWTYVFLVVGTWIAMTSSLFTGLIANLWLGRPGAEFADMNSVFGLVVKRAITENAWYNILGSIMLTASCAAFMSTADSAVNACVSLLTLDFLHPIISNKYSWKPKAMLYGGKVLSVAISFIALFFSRIEIGLGSLITLQGMILCQVAPAYILGFFNLSLHAYPVLLGQVVGVSLSIAYQCANDYCVKGPVAVDWYGPWDGIQPGFFAVCVNIVVAWGGSYLWTMFNTSIPSWDQVHIVKFEGDIPEHLLNPKADGISRPWTLFPWNIVFLLAFVIHCFTTPWWFDYHDPEVNFDSASFPNWVWACGLCRLLGDLLFIAATFVGWQDAKTEGQVEGEGEETLQVMKMGEGAIDL